MMNKLPTFLSAPNNHLNNFINPMCSYQALLGVWLIKLSFFLGWMKPPEKFNNIIFLDDEFLELTGISLRVSSCDGGGGNIIDAAGQKTAYSVSVPHKILKQRLEELSHETFQDSLSIFTNIEVIGNLLGLNDAAKAVFSYAAVVSLFPKFSSVLGSRNQKISDQQLIQIIARLTGHAEHSIRDELNANSPLIAGGLISLDSEFSDIETKVCLINCIGMVICEQYDNQDKLLNAFLKKASASNLTLSDFPHLKQDIDALKTYLSNSINQQQVGVNILLHGIPGTGKTEFIKALSNELGTDLYEISFSNQTGNPISGRERLESYNLCQRILRKQNNALLMFDEIEDIFNQYGLYSSDTAKFQINKAWINRILEKNAIPAFWVTNNVEIDPAYLRRFDYSIKFTVPPKNVRLEIAKRYLSQFNPTEDWLVRIASNENISPSQYESAAKLARVSGFYETQDACLLIEQVLQRSISLLGQHRLPLRNTIHTKYNLDLINIDFSADKIIAGLKINSSGTFCFYGPAGTGKSEFARYIAEAINMPIIVRRASDILSMWVGETEKNIADMFAEARQQNAVIILDEADSLLVDRSNVQQSWEISQVNEFLTQIEAFDGIFVCTTNLMDKLDQASLRRFTFKIKFDYLTSDQRWAMFNSELTKLGNSSESTLNFEKAIRNLENLTPGDFSVVSRKVTLMKELANPKEFYENLVMECESKGILNKGMGFLI